MRLLPLVALTLCLAGASARVGDYPYSKYRKEYSKGLALDPAAGGGGEADDEQDHRMDAEDNERDDGHEDEEMTSDDAEDSGKTKETSVHRKHFMDQYFMHSGPVEYEFGHVCEDPNDWEQRYEKKDFNKHRHQGQVKWGDADGGYGEQLWDFNHGGNIEDEDFEFDYEPKTKGRLFEGRNNNGNTARGVIKEKVTITKKKNGKTIDQTKINMEKHADLDDIVKKMEPQPFAGDIALMEEFNRRTQGVGKKFTPFEKDDMEDDSEEDDSKGYFSFNQEIRRLGDAAPVAGHSKKEISNTMAGDKASRNRRVSEIRRYDTVPQGKEKRTVSAKEPKDTPSADLVSKATINIDTAGKVNFDPITGSLTDSKTGRKFKIFGVLVDS